MMAVDLIDAMLYGGVFSFYMIGILGLGMEMVLRR
jgi:hypothetical protein